MELKRRRKEEEKTSTENKIEEVKVSEFKALVLITFFYQHFSSEINTECRAIQGQEGIPAGNCFAILCWIGDVRGWGLLLF